MSIFNYLKNLLPIIGKDTILEEIRTTRISYSKSYMELSNTFRNVSTLKFKHPTSVNLNSAYMNALSNNKYKNLPEHFINSIPNIIANLELLEKFITNELDSSVSTTNITYKKATFLQLTAACTFALSYGLNIINYFLYLEEEEHRKKIEGSEKQPELPKPIIDKIHDGFKNFLIVMNVFSRPVENVEQSLRDIPEVIVDNVNYKELATIHGNMRVDPFNFSNVLGFHGNPIFYIRKWKAERQVAKQRLLQETIQSLKTRKLLLERTLAGKQDAALQRQVDALQSRINALHKELEEMEKD